MPVGTGTVCLPLGPSTFRCPSPIASFTPFGSGIGFFPTRDIFSFPYFSCCRLLHAPAHSNSKPNQGFTATRRRQKRCKSYQTWQRTSPPTPSLRALDPVITPRGVVKILIPNPPRTRGTALDPTYTRQPGRETRSIREITGRLPGVYLR